MGDGPEADDVADELALLSEENARLRALLGMEERPAAGHAVAWSPSLLSSSMFGPPVDAQSSNDAKLERFRSLFGARFDVFALRWENASTGKSGWSPATRGGWSHQRRSQAEYLPLTDEVLASHLRGQQAVGIYPLLRGDTCGLLACDFDKGAWVLDALAYLDACHANGVPAVLERSRSGNGGHVWVFFASPVPASEARALGAALLRQAMAARAEMDLSSYDRFFPSQDFLPKAGFGNLIALPLQGEYGRAGNTLFLDPKSLEPYPDQWAFLSTVARLAPDAVSELAATLRPADAGPAVSLAELARQGGPPPPPVVRGQLAGRLSLERTGLPPPVLAALKHLGSIACHHIPAVSFAACVEAARSRRWLGLTATPYRRDKLEAIIGFHCGPTRHEIKPGSVADRRTAQISVDVQAAVANGRTCLVLTQRTDHIDAIVGRLAVLGVDALVLRGGLGKKARAAVSDAIATRSPDDGIVLVATGSYLGEGFDWPELDSLFLAFPLAFKGRVVQYVGRLLRTHAHKHHVELHDYVDVRVPVLDRMHTKRLPAYATLGFETPKGPRRRRPPAPPSTTDIDAF